MKVNCFLMVSQARNVPDEGWHIVGPLDRIETAPLAHAPPNAPIPWPECFLVAHIAFAESDGRSHRIAVEMHSEDGRQLTRRLPIATYELRPKPRWPKDRPVPGIITALLRGLHVPAFGGYQLVLFVNDQEAARYNFYVDDSGS